MGDLCPSDFYLITDTGISMTIVQLGNITGMIEHETAPGVPIISKRILVLTNFPNNKIFNCNSCRRDEEAVLLCEFIYKERSTIHALHLH